MTEAPTQRSDAELEQRKRLSTLRARFAIKGFAVHDTPEGYLVLRWGGLHRLCRSVDELDSFAKTMEVA